MSYYSQQTEVGNGTKTDFTVTFPYLDKAHVHVRVGDTEKTFTWLDNTTIRLDSTPASGAVITIERKSPISQRPVDFSVAPLLRETLNTNVDYWVYAVQELNDKFQFLQNQIDEEVLLPEAAAQALQNFLQLTGMVNAAWFGVRGVSKEDRTTDSSDALQVAVDFACALKLKLELPAGYINGSKSVCVWASLLAEGKGMGSAHDGIGYPELPGTILRAIDPPAPRTPGDQRYTMTRVRYQGSGSDPGDAPISAFLNIQAPSVVFCHMTILCDYDPTNLSPTHYGALWDTLFFVGCRQHVSLHQVALRGYPRLAHVHYDVTRLGFGNPEITIPNIPGVAKPGFTPAYTAAGCDGATLSDVFIRGGKWGLLVKGPDYKTGYNFPGWKLGLNATVTFSGQPASGDTLNLNGVTITFRSTVTTTDEIEIGVTLADTLTNLLNYLQNPDRVFAIRRADYDVDLTTNVVSVLQNDEGTLLTSYTLAKSSTAITLSGATVTTTPDPALFWNGTSAVKDDRGEIGFSDFLVIGSAIYGTDHHSNRRRNDIAATPDPNTDEAGGAMYIDGGCANGYARIHGHTFVRCRFATFEPYIVRLGRTARDVFISCHFEHRQGPSRLTTAGVSLPSGKDASKFYGPIAMKTGAARPLKTKLIACDQTPYSEYFRTTDDGIILGNSRGDIEGRRITARERVTTNLLKGTVDADMEVQSGTGKNTRIRTNGNETALYCTTSNINFSKSLVPGTTGTLNLGSNTINVNNAYLQNAPIVASDSRLKDELPLPPLGLAFLNSLRPVRFKMKDRTVPGEDVEGNPIEVHLTFERTHEGLIAQEVKAALDTAGTDSAMWCLGEDGYHRLRLEELVPVAIKAIQELSARVAALENPSS